MKISDFFKDKDGNVVIIQPPNLLIAAWLVLQLAIVVTGNKSTNLPFVATAVLFTWAYMELRQGLSPFRRALGGLVLVAILIGLFIG